MSRPLDAGDPRRLQTPNHYPLAKRYSDAAAVQLRQAEDMRRAIGRMSMGCDYHFNQTGIDCDLLESRMGIKRDE